MDAKHLKIVPIHVGSLIGDPVTAKTAAKNWPDEFRELYQQMTAEYQKLIAEQPSLFDYEQTKKATA